MRTTLLALAATAWTGCSTTTKPTHVATGEDSASPVDDPAPTDDTATSTDSGTGQDSSSPPPDDTADTDDSGDPADLVPATATAGDPITCTNPEVRESQPVINTDFGADWADQNATGGSTDPIAAGGLTMADLTGDGRMDIYLPQIGADQLYVGQADGTLADESGARLSSDGIPSATAASAVDIEGDGDLDLFVTTSRGQNQLLLNDGTGHFTDGTVASGLAEQGWPGAASLWGDMDGDDDLDLFVVTYRNCDPAIAIDPENPWSDTPQALWENQGDGTFIDVTDRMAEHPGENGRLRAGAWIDIDGDQDLDLHLVSDKSVSSPCMPPNLVFENDGGDFTETSGDMALDITMEGMGLGIGDLNDDGNPDFAMSDMRRLWTVESDPTGAWYDSTAVHGLRYDPDEAERWSGWGIELADLDNNSHLDIYLAFGGLPDAPVADMNPMAQPDAVFLQSPDGSFTEVATEWGVDDMQSNRAVVTADFNRDGWLDLARRTLDGPATLSLAQCGASSWLAIDLQQAGTNPRAIGAKVSVTVADNTMHRWVTVGATGLQSSTEPTVHFGLDEATMVDQLEVLWPDGTRSRLTDLGVNRFTTVARADDD